MRGSRALVGQRRLPDLRAKRGRPYLSPPPISTLISPYAPDLNFVHPDVLYVPEGWNGYRYWMGITPYPDDPRENPSIYASHDGLTWEAPPGIVNPVAPNTGGYNSDPDIVLYGGVLHLFYRQVGTGEKIWLRTSSDGVTWSAGAQLFQAAAAGDPFVCLSPAVVHDGAQWVMYATDATSIFRRTAPAAAGPWSAPATCTYPAPTYGQTGVHTPWHLDAMRRSGKTYLLINEAAQTGRNLRFAVSVDGLSFTPAATPFKTTPTASNWDGDSLYRFTAVPRPGEDLLYVYYSAHGPNGWRIGRLEVLYDELP